MWNFNEFHNSPVNLSQFLKDFIGIDSFYRDLDPAFHRLPPSSTTERWGNDGANGDLAVITFNSWPCQRRKRMEKIEVQTHDILGVPYQANPALWICTIFVSVPPWSSMYCVCMYMHISWNIETYVNKDTCRHVHVNRHLRFFSTFGGYICDYMWRHVTTMSHVEILPLACHPKRKPP